MLDAVESLSFVTDGSLLALNSYENRVYRVGLESGGVCAAKFYRPGRWSDAAIIEEHDFTLALHDAGLSVVPPMRCGGATLHRHGSFRFTLYPWQGGRPLELDNSEQLEQIGRLLARVHTVGRERKFSHRMAFDFDSRFREPVEFLLQSSHIPDYLTEPFRSLTSDIAVQLQAAFERAGNVSILRLHGDCHPGNILVNNDGPFLLDFDDTGNGPAIQDIWMFLSGERDYQQARLADVLAGYTVFADFDPRELHLVAALRTMRQVYFAAWLARRWDDPAFPTAFPWFGEPRYWEDMMLNLREQAADLQHDALPWEQYR